MYTKLYKEIWDYDDTFNNFTDIFIIFVSRSLLFAF